MDERRFDSLGSAMMCKAVGAVPRAAEQNHPCLAPDAYTADGSKQAHGFLNTLVPCAKPFLILFPLFFAMAFLERDKETKLSALWMGDVLGFNLTGMRRTRLLDFCHAASKGRVACHLSVCL